MPPAFDRRVGAGPGLLARSQGLNAPLEPAILERRDFANEALAPTVLFGAKLSNRPSRWEGSDDGSAVTIRC